MMLLNCLSNQNVPVLNLARRDQEQRHLVDTINCRHCLLDNIVSFKRILFIKADLTLLY